MGGIILGSHKPGIGRYILDKNWKTFLNNAKVLPISD